MNDCEEFSVPLRTNVLVDSMGSKSALIWNKKVPNTQMEKFQRVIEKKYNMHFDSYWDFHQWSVDNYVEFWEEIWKYFDVIASKPYDQVFKKTGPGFLDNDWFSGALLNYAENILRIRDDRIALICADELNHEEKVTFREMFKEVSLYAAAFRKMGLTAGDRVASYMSNRKETVFAMLAATSIGAVWSGPLPYYGAQAATRIIKSMKPKVLISVDSLIDDGEKFYPMDNLYYISKFPSLEKIIIVPTVKAKVLRYLSNIPKSVLLNDFLQLGRKPDGTVQDIVFEQLPVNHPVCINFTLGTIGLPKGSVHSAEILLPILRDLALHRNIESGDVVYNHYPAGWATWDILIPSLALGATLYLFDGSAFYSTDGGGNIWNTFSQYKVTYAFLASSTLDKLEKMKIFPHPNLNLDHLKIIEGGSNPMKLQNFEFLHKVKKELFVGNQYGSSEVLGSFSGYDFNTPAYSGEIQVPSLGMDLKCFDHKGCSVIGQRGEMVICKPAPSFPVYLWRDQNNQKMRKTYLSKYEGVWSQNDECWINPVTKGLVVIGRSDDTVKQYGEIFGASDIYFAIQEVDELEDYICFPQDGLDGDTQAVLFVKLRKGQVFTPQLRDKIAETIKRQFTEYHVPQVIMETPDVPYNLNNKRMESLVRMIAATNKIPHCTTIRNPECLRHFCDIPELVNYCKNGSA